MGLIRDAAAQPAAQHCRAQKRANDYDAMIKLRGFFNLDGPAMKRCVVGLRHPDQAKPSPTSKDESTVWFASMASLAAVLSEDNRALLRVIHTAKPKSLTELAALAGRKVPNLSRTVKTMACWTCNATAATCSRLHWRPNFW